VTPVARATPIDPVHLDAAGAGPKAATDGEAGACHCFPYSWLASAALVIF